MTTVVKRKPFQVVSEKDLNKKNSYKTPSKKEIVVKKAAVVKTYKQKPLKSVPAAEKKQFSTFGFSDPVRNIYTVDQLLSLKPVSFPLLDYFPTKYFIFLIFFLYFELTPCFSSKERDESSFWN